MITGIQSDLKITVCAGADDAMRRGYLYRQPEFKPMRVVEVVVVKEGTMSGNSTVDIIVEDENGQKHVAMLTSALWKMVPAFGPDHV